jgi:hypothetical protein
LPVHHLQRIIYFLVIKIGTYNFIRRIEEFQEFLALHSWRTNRMSGAGHVACTRWIINAYKI